MNLDLEKLWKISIFMWNHILSSFQKASIKQHCSRVYENTFWGKVWRLFANIFVQKTDLCFTFCIQNSFFLNLKWNCQNICFYLQKYSFFWNSKSWARLRIRSDFRGTLKKIWISENPQTIKVSVFDHVDKESFLGEDQRKEINRSVEDQESISNGDLAKSH